MLEIKFKKIKGDLIMSKTKSKITVFLNILVGVMIFLGLVVSTQSYARTTTRTVTKTTTKAKAKARSSYVSSEEDTITLSSTEDPDGDNDNKGYNYFPLRMEPTGNKVFIFDPNFKAWAIYDAEGDRINTGKASGGKYYCSDVGRGCKTISGKFRIISKGGAGCISNKYPIETGGGAPMPYCMYFSGKGYGIHGSNDVPNHNASHGCIRVTPTVARWLSQNFIELGTTVIVRQYR
jgi:hypothetical protein